MKYLIGENTKYESECSGAFDNMSNSDSSDALEIFLKEYMNSGLFVNNKNLKSDFSIPYNVDGIDLETNGLYEL